MSEIRRSSFVSRFYDSKFRRRGVIITFTMALAAFGAAYLIPTIPDTRWREAAQIPYYLVVVVAFLYIAAYLWINTIRIGGHVIQQRATGITKYRFDPKGGFKYGREGSAGVRNVLIRVKTLQGLVIPFYEYVRKKSSITEADHFLWKIGHSIGRSFAGDFAEQVLPPNVRLSREMLKEWWEYDYYAGLVNFDFSNFDPSRTSGKIKIKGHALNYLRTDEKPVLCPFFEGYVAAVIDHFSDDDMELTSICKQSGHRECEFIISRKDLTIRKK